MVNAKNRANIVIAGEGGIYRLQDAARYLSAPRRTVERWAFGYRRRDKEYKPVITTHLPVIDGERAVTFLELVELMFIGQFLRAGARWNLVHRAARTAARMYKVSHPFAMRKWFADPAGIYTLLEDKSGAETLIELSGDGQVAMQATLAMYLDQLDFDVELNVAARWFPMGKQIPVVLDPRRAFGAPVIDGTAVQTAVLAEMYRGTGSTRDVAWWYELDEYQVEAAVKFENKFAA